MSKFKAFLKGNAKPAENVSIKLERFEDEIVLRPISSGEADAITDRCFRMKPGKKGKMERSFDGVKYNRELAIASIVHPDLNDVELQESYGVRGADNLYSELFLLGEANEILEKVTDISGLDKAMDDEIEEAKN